MPCYNKSWNIFKSSDDIFIPYNNVCKIGDDVILVEIFVANKQQPHIKGRGKTQYMKTTTLSMTQNENVNDETNISNNSVSLQNPIQINASPNNQNNVPLYPQNNMSYNTKDINQ